MMRDNKRILQEDIKLYQKVKLIEIIKKLNEELTDEKDILRVKNLVKLNVGSRNNNVSDFILNRNYNILIKNLKQIAEKNGIEI